LQKNGTVERPEALRGIAKRPEAVLFVIALLSYAFFYQAGGWNQNVRLDLARALVEQGTARIDAYAQNTGDKACRGPEGRCTVARPGVDHYYSDKAPGVSWLSAPVWAGVWALRGDRGESKIVAVGSYLATLFAIAFPAALGIVALFVSLRALAVEETASAGLCAAYAFGTLAFPYATLLHGVQLAAALGSIGFAALVRWRDDPDGPGFGASVLVGLCLGTAVAAEYPVVLVAGAVFTYAATRPWSGRSRVLGGLLIGGAIPAVALAAYHATAFGGVFTTGYAFSTQPHRGSGAFMGIGAPRPEAIWGLTFSAYRGLFFTAPWLLLALPGWFLLWKRARAEAAVGLFVAVTFFWMNASLLDWQGGWAPGPRYLVPSLPFWVVGAAGVFLGASGRRRGVFPAAFAVLAGISVTLMLVATSVGPEVSERIARPYSEHLVPRFLAGELAGSRQSFEMIRPDPEGGRQAWNAGQLLGLRGIASLLPLAVIWVGGGVWLRRALAASPKKKPPLPVGVSDP